MLRRRGQVHWRLTLMRDWLAILTITYPAILDAMLVLLQCKVLGQQGRYADANSLLDGLDLPADVVSRTLAAVERGWMNEERVGVDLSRQCWANEHLAWAVTWVIPIGVLYMIATLTGTWHVVRPRAHHARLLQSAPGEAFAFLSQGYASDRQYWELVHMGLLMAQLTGVMLWNGVNPSLAAGCALTILAMRFAVSGVFRPYSREGGSFRQNKPHYLDILSGTTLLLTATAMALLYSLRQGKGEDSCVGEAGSSWGLVTLMVMLVAQTVFLLTAAWMWHSIGARERRKCEPADQAALATRHFESSLDWDS